MKLLTLKKIKYKFVFLLLLLACFQCLVIFKIESVSVKPVHILSILCVFFIKKKIHFNLYISSYLLYITLVSLIASLKFGINSLIINYIFGFYILVLFCEFGKNLKYDAWISMIRRVASTVMFIVWVKNLLNINVLISFFKHPWAHPDIDTIFEGGVNLEATWLAMFAFFFYGSQYKYLYIISSFLISAVYASRVGILINVLVLTWFIWPILKKISIKKIVFMMFVLAIAVIFIIKTGVFTYVFERFMIIGEDPGSLGRLTMWQYFLDAFWRYPFGCGIGNNMKALNSVSSVYMSDGNMHNIYLQNFIDVGFIGGIWYILMCFGFVIKELKHIFSDPFVAFLMTYILICVLQFRGGDTIVFMILGIYLSEHCKMNIYYR